MPLYDYHSCNNRNHNHPHCTMTVLIPLLLWAPTISATSFASKSVATAASFRSVHDDILKSSASRRVLRAEEESPPAAIDEIDSGIALQEGDEMGDFDIGEFSSSNSTAADEEGELDLGEFSISDSDSNLDDNRDVDAADEDDEDEDEDEDGSIEVGEFSSANSQALDGRDETKEQDEGSLEMGQISNSNSNSSSNFPRQSDEEQPGEEEDMTQWPDPITLPSTEEEGDDEELDRLPTDFLPPDFFPSTEIDESNEENGDPTADLCSCSPRSYGFRLTLDQSCLVNDLNDNDGIGVTLCILTNGNDSDNENVTDTDTVVPVVVTSLQFLEFDTSGNLVVINQDDTYDNVTFQNGDIVRYDSVTKDLDENLNLENQQGFLPGGIQLTIRGRRAESGNDDDEDAMVVNRLTWSYTNECQFVPVENGDRIGWVTIEEIEPASTAFCPALVTTTTTTSTTTTTTTAATTTTTTMMATTTAADTTTTTATTETTEPTAIDTTTTTKPHAVDSKSSKMAKSSTLDAKAGKKYSSSKSDSYHIFTKSAKQTVSSSKSGKTNDYDDIEDMSMAANAAGNSKSGKSERLFRKRSRQGGMIRRR